MDNTPKLYEIKLRGLSGTRYSPAYVVATDPTTAYQVLRRFLDAGNLGYSGDREFDTVRLVADANEHGKSPLLLETP